MTEAALFYEAASNGLGTDSLDDIQQAIDRVREHPKLGIEVAAGLKRLLLHRFPFSLIYSITANEILIVSVAHHRRWPRYWQSRINS